MTREDAINFAECLKHNYTINFADMEVFCDMAIKALEQEPCEDGKNEVLDKIRAEIEELHLIGYATVDGKREIASRAVMQIIDKYKAEKARK